MRAVSVVFVGAALCFAIEDPAFDHQTTTYTANLKTTTDANVDATIVSVPYSCSLDRDFAAGNRSHNSLITLFGISPPLTHRHHFFRPIIVPP